MSRLPLQRDDCLAAAALEYVFVRAVNTFATSWSTAAAAVIIIRQQDKGQDSKIWIWGAQ